MISFLLPRGDICWHLHFVETTIFHLSVKYEDEWFYCIVQKCWIGINLRNVQNSFFYFLDELHFWVYISRLLNSSCCLGKCGYNKQGFKGVINVTESSIVADCHIGIFLVIHKHCVCVCALEKKLKICAGSFKTEELGFLMHVGWCWLSPVFINSLKY